MTGCISLFRRTGLLICLGGLLAIFSLGCSSSMDSSRYPSDLRYPSRQDLVLKEELKLPPVMLPSPGHLDESIRKACELKENKETGLDPRTLSKEDRKDLRDALAEIFGTPAAPRAEPLDPENVKREKDVKAAEENRKLFDERLGNNLRDFKEYGVTPTSIDDLNVDASTLRKGSAHYRKNCLHCHGLAGDGRGPTGPWVHPHPRDYRLGQFKFISTNEDNAKVPNRKPRRKDLVRTLSKGIDGTSMPAFGLLPEQELEEMASYVIHLSIRGQTEQEVIRKLLLDKPDKALLEKGYIRTEVYNTATSLLVQWAISNVNEPIKPGDYPYDESDKAEIDKSVTRGYQLFLGKGACMKCHMDYGRQLNPPYLYDQWGTLVQPRNLTAGNYRGGRRPIDLYWRISGGIPPSGMPGAKDLNAKERWDLVNFVQRLPYPAMLPTDIRDKVYAPSRATKTTEAHASR